MLGELTPAEIEQILDTEVLGRIGCISAEGMKWQGLLDRLLPLLHSDRSAVPAPPGHTPHATVYRIRLREKTGRFERHAATEAHPLDSADRQAQAPI
jgi:hypothetical protein